MSANKKFLWAFALSAIVFIAGKIALGFLLAQFASNIRKDNAWIRELYVIKNSIAKEDKFSDKPKIIFVGGSSVLFGLDMPIIEEITGRPALNFSSNGAFDAEFLFSKAIPYVRPGDLVVGALEWQYYGNRDGWFAYQAKNILEWDREYFRSLSFPERFMMIFKLDRFFFIRGIGSIFNPDKYNPFPDDKLLEIWKTSPDPENPEQFSYSFRNIKKDGTYLAPTKNTYAGNEQNFMQVSFDLDQIKRIEAIARKVESKGARFIIAPPPNLICKGFSFNNPDAREKYAKIKDIWKNCGLEAPFDPKKYSYPRDMFSDSSYHLNRTGQKLHSKILARDVDMFLKSKQTKDSGKK